MRVPAVYEDGVFKPLNPVALDEHAAVDLEISERGAHHGTDSAAATKGVHHGDPRFPLRRTDGTILSLGLVESIAEDFN